MRLQDVVLPRELNTEGELALPQSKCLDLALTNHPSVGAVVSFLSLVNDNINGCNAEGNVWSRSAGRSHNPLEIWRDA